MMGWLRWTWVVLLLCSGCGGKEKAVSGGVMYFEIPVTDMQRATEFYSKVFGFDFEMQRIDGNEMALFPVNEKGASGALAKGESYHPSVDGTRVYFQVADIRLTMQKALAAGGKELYPVTSLGEAGQVAEFSDSEGNRVALHQRQGN